MTGAGTATPPCRLCAAPLTTTFLDLGMSPLCENFLRADQLDAGETFYPLHVRICDECLLVQLQAYVGGEEIFSDYAYFSSYSQSWVEHARGYAHRMVAELGLGPDSLVTEVASNDGYLLRHFVDAGVPVLGVEPAANVGAVARAAGVRTETRFLGAQSGAELAERYGRADLVVANNVYAHIPDLIGFTAGLAALVKPGGLVTLEFQHLMRLIERNQYDTVYHEHYHYLTLLTAQRALATAGLTVVHVEELPSHGGSLRVFARPAGAPEAAVKELLAAEAAAGLHTVAGHRGFAESVFQVKRDLVDFLHQARAEGRRVVGYGAPGKGNTLLNHCAVRADLLEYTVDRNPHKHGRFLPGTHIPIHHPDRIAADRPDYVLVLPWNLRKEISAQLAYIGDWGGRLVFPIPRLEVVTP
ncbi:class I SAM-dependent methyltransferase [Catellatospora chokoriensis]|uniref:Methyltransferase n=1 Tax=Catellatospora chokoriensis TaxID=310353 RepID=A0A8J3K2B3_9ACTN|nr:class I SAM-dependent methyltransferase [Catellatospora chokoriensis]GIF87219.1 methyltransferase [Catellatospora chokoriensis]